MVRFLAGLLWELSEFTGIGLGRFAPMVFGTMIGCEGKRIVGKIGDVIEWDFKDPKYKDYPDYLRGKVFSAEIAMVDLEDEHYGVYPDYGQDMIPFNECKIIKRL